MGRPSAARLSLPGELLAFADREIEGLGGAAKVAFLFGPRLPFDWLPGDRLRYSAMTLWRTVHVRDRGVPFSPLQPLWLELLLHELVHVAQYRRLGTVGFPLVYLGGLAASGYDAHPLEAEARTRAAELAAKFLASR
jgi:hypothetical protein